jgi:integrase
LGDRCPQFFPLGTRKKLACPLISSTVQELLGHRDISTTMIYPMC